jgi:hypothetical protein
LVAARFIVSGHAIAAGLRRFAFLCVAIGILVGGCCGRSLAETPRSVSNHVAAFLNNAERQTETDEQRVVVRGALGDMLRNGPFQLKLIRYPDYSGTPNMWSITELLEHYFVPSHPMSIDQDAFYRDVASPDAKQAIQKQLALLSHAIRGNRRSPQ